MTRSTLIRAVGLVASLVLVATACSGGDDNDGATPDDPSGDAATDRLVIALAEEPQDLDPHGQAQEAPDSQYYEQLTRINQAGEVEPFLAAEMPVATDDSARKWTVSLRDGVVFHDGTPLTAELVADSLNALMAGTDNGEEALRLRESRTGATAIDDLTLQIELSTAQPLMPQLLAFIHVTKPDNPAAADHPIGTGPYELVEWRRGEFLTLARFDDYWGDEPEVEEIEYRFIPEASTQIAAFQAGELDILVNLSAENAAQLHEGSVSTAESGDFNFLILNPRAGITQDVRVRQAMDLAIDREALNGLFDGAAEVLACQPLKSTYLGYSEDLAPKEYDPDRARELFAEAGVEGTPIELIAPEGRWPHDREQSEAIAQMWTEAGLPTTVRVLALPEDYLDALLDQSDGRVSAIFGNRSTAVLDGSNTDSYFAAPGAESGPSTSTQETSDRFEEARQITDLDARAEAWQTLYADVCEQSYFAYLLSPPVLWAFSDQVAELNVLPLVEPSWNRVADIEVAS